LICPEVTRAFSEDKNSVQRENFDLANELAHLLCHSHVEVASDNLAMVERQANYFAGALLLTSQGISSGSDVNLKATIFLN